MKHKQRMVYEKYSMPWTLKFSFTFRLFLVTIWYIFLTSPTHRMCPASQILLDLIITVLFGEDKEL